MKDFFRVLFCKDICNFLRKKGVRIGKDVVFIKYPHPWSIPNVGSEPYLISIGDGSVVLFGVTFITHDGAVYVVRKKEKYKNVIKFGRIIIGENCFIGCNSIIMPNVEIGKNSIVGAGSVVTKSIPNGEVWAGNPAHFICKIEQYAEKMLAVTPRYNLDELKNEQQATIEKIADKYREQAGR